MKINVNELLNTVSNLSENFAIAVQAVKLIDKEDTDVTDLSKLISSDQALTSKLLKLCNSANYSYSRKISSVNDAITLIGFKELKSILFAVVSKNVLSRDVKGYELSKNMLWENAVTCAVYGKYLAKKYKYPDPDLVFTASLLRDIGKLVIQQYVGDAFDEITNSIYKDKITFSQAEEKILGTNHTIIGSELAKKWNFPEKLVDAIRFHHNFDEAVSNNVSDLKLIALVHFADVMTMILGAGIGNDGMMYSMNNSAMSYLGLKPDTGFIENTISELLEFNPEIQTMMGISNDK